MKQAIIYIIYLPLLSWLFSSCKSPCEGGSLSFEYYGYDSIVYTDIQVKRFAKKSQFTVLMYSDSLSITDNPGTKRLYYDKGSGIYLDEKYDWEISLPLAGRTDRVSDISQNKDSNGGGLGERRYCFNGFIYTLNGIKYATAEAAESNLDNHILIRK